MRRRLDELQTAGSAASLEHAQGLETLAFNSSAIASALSKVRRARLIRPGNARSHKALPLHSSRPTFDTTAAKYGHQRHHCS